MNKKEKKTEGKEIAEDAPSKKKKVEILKPSQWALFECAIKMEEGIVFIQR